MYKIASTFVFVCIISMAFISCESEMEIKGLNQIKPHLVLNTVLKAEADTNRLYITRSRTVFHNISRSELYGYGGYIGNYPHIKDAEISFTVNGSEYVTPYYQPDSSYIFRERFLKQGDEVNIKVKHGRDIAEASVVIPEPPQVLSVDTSSFRSNSHYTMDYLRFRVKIKDKPGDKNYYRLRLESRSFSYQFTDYSYMSWAGSIHSEDPVLTNGFRNNDQHIDIELVSYPKNEFWIFTDNLFEGQEYTLDFYTEKVSATVYSEQMNLTVYLQSISEDLYNYYYSLLKFKEADESLNEPVLIYNNVENGLGIVGTINEVILLEHEDIYERDEDDEWPYPFY